MNIYIKQLFIAITFIIFKSVSFAQSLTVEQVSGLAEVLVANDNFNTQKRLTSDMHLISGKKVVVFQDPDATNSTDKNIRCLVLKEDMTLLTSFIVNKTTTGDQMLPVVKVNQQDNSFVVVWSSWINNTNSSDAPKYDIYAKKINFDNITTDAQKADLLINSEVTVGRQISPLIAFDYQKNEAVIAWVDQDGQDNNTPTVVDYGSYARRISLAGDLSLLSGQFLINVQKLGHQTITALEIIPSTGELFTVCQSQNYSGANYDVIFRRFTRDGSGNFVGGTESTINKTTTGDQLWGSIILNTYNGNYALAYSSPDNSGWGSYCKIFDKYGNLVKDEFRINQIETNNQLVAKGVWDEENNVLLFFYWFSISGNVNVRYQFFDGNYNAIGTEQTAETVNLQNYYAGIYSFVMDKQRRKLLLTFDEFNSSSGGFSKGYVKHFSYVPPAVTNSVSTSDVTYVEVKIPQRGIKNKYDLVGATEMTATTGRTYLDGLGRKRETVVRKASPNKKDMVKPVEYDQYGRIVKNFLPYTDVSSDGKYKNDYATTQAAFYNNSANNNADKIVTDANPFSKIEYDGSPLNIITKQIPQGAAWQTGEHSIRQGVKTNAANEIRKWAFDISTNTATGTVFYDAGQLYLIQITDEDNNIVLIYKNKSGNTVLERRQSGSNYLDTYYVYDDFQVLRFVIPPQAVSLLSGVNYVVGYTGTFNDQWLFTYKYDIRGRITEKKVPGAGVEYYVYDTNDNIILTQNSNQRLTNRWVYTKFDQFGRVIQSGIYTHPAGSSQASMQTAVDYTNSSKWYEQRQTGTTYGYTNILFPTENCEALSLNYYDDYDTDFNGTADYSYAVQNLVNEATVNTTVNGLTTVSKTKILGSSNWLTTVTFYDKLYRPIQVQGNNHKNLASLGDISTVVYNFIDQPVYSKQVINPGSNPVTICKRLDYDHMGRLVKEWQKVNTDAEVLLAQFNYNELGQLIEKNLHSENSGSTYLQSIDYTYNIRGWLKDINNANFDGTENNNNDANDLLSIALRYEQTTSSMFTPKYNGKLSMQVWRSVNNSFLNTYTYDGFDRLSYNQQHNDAAGSPNNSYKEQVTYDLNGNIKTMLRTAASQTVVDNMAYSYDGNRLIKITDAADKNVSFLDKVDLATEYTYDSNGNLTADMNKGISLIQYGYYNNLPQVIQLGSALNRIEYTYSADGVKLTRKVYSNNTLQKTYDYIGGAIFENNVIVKIETTQGRLAYNGSTYVNEYDIRDHLGNVRVSFTKDVTTGTAKIIQEDHYYAFGGKMGGTYSLIPSSQNRMLYNGQEKELEFPSETYDFNARFYDPLIGRFMSIDPLADFDNGISPFAFCSGDPVNFNDPAGLSTGTPGDGGNDPIKMTNSSPGVTVSGSRYSDGGMQGSFYLPLSFRMMDVMPMSPIKSRPIPSLPTSMSMPTMDLNLRPTISQAASVESVANNDTQDENDNSVSEPGLLESFIPVWGSGRAAVDHFQRGNFWRGLGYTALAISDVFLVKAVATAVVKGTITLAAKYAVRQAVKNPKFVGKEAAAMAANPRVAAMMKGKGVDRAFRAFAEKNIILNGAKKIGLIKINPMNKGADMIGKGLLKGMWWDVTTTGSWLKHVAKYGEGGIGLFY